MPYPLTKKLTDEELDAIDMANYYNKQAEEQAELEAFYKSLEQERESPMSNYWFKQ
jgi:hypothetical protein